MASTSLSDRINRRRRLLGLTVAELAGAAGLHPATVHRLVRGTTRAPRPVTLRKLARALSVPLEELTDQIELHALSDSYEPGHPLEELIVEQLLDVDITLYHAAATAAVGAMLDVEMGTGRYVQPGAWEQLQRSSPSGLTRSQCQKLLREQFRRVPRLLQRAAAREALRAMVDVERRRGRQPSKDLYHRLGHRQVKALPVRSFSWRKRQAPLDES